jgi:hypothetical protein
MEEVRFARINAPTDLDRSLNGRKPPFVEDIRFIMWFGGRRKKNKE